MYIYITAFIKLISRNGRWVEQDITQMTLKELFEKTTGAWLVLTHTSFDDVLEEGEEPKKVSLDIYKLQTTLAWQEITVSEWLTQNGSSVLPTEEGEVEFVTKTVGYRDAWSAGYDINTIKPGIHPEVFAPKSEQTDLILTKDDVDYQDFYKHCLVSVNGIIHQTSYSEHGIYVTDGAVSGKIHGDNHVGVTSFKDVGEVSFKPITSDMVHPHSEGRPLTEGCYIDLNTDIEGKTVFLVLGGYLHALDNVCKQVGDQVFKIDFLNYPMAQKLIELKDHIDLKSLELTTYDKNPDLMEVGELYSDEVIKAYLGLSQSFFVILDAQDVYVEKHLLERTQLPGRWYSHVAPVYPLLKGDGKLEDYTWHSEQGVYVVRAYSNYEVRQYNFETTEWRDDPGVDSTRPTERPIVYSRGFLLEIGKDV